MNQEQAWEEEYRSKKMLSPSLLPQADVVRFSRWLKKDKKKQGAPLDMEEVTVLDLGSGTGRNSLYYAQQGAKVTGYEISATALAMAEKSARHAELPVTFEKRDIGVAFQLPSASFDIVLDVTSSNSLNDDERKIYVKEVTRVLKSGGYLFVRALSLEGDPHAKKLVEQYPAGNPDTYKHPDLGIIEKVFSRQTFTDTYAPYFKIALLERISHYPLVAGRRYKRQYWIAYLEKLPTE
jgi:SAM-dependent methyltransferase